MIKNSKLLSTLLLVSFLIFISCSPNIYTISQLQENEKYYNKTIKKKVQVRKQDDRVIMGHFWEMKKDSIIIYLDKRNHSKEIIANREIKFIKVQPEAEPAVLGLVIFGFTLFLLAVGGFAKGVSNTN